MSIKQLIKDVLILVVLIGIISAIAIPMFVAHRRSVYDADVKAILKSTAKAQAVYFKDKSTFAANIDSLPAFNQSDNVNITMEATTTTFIITGTVKVGCSPNTGTWTFNSTTGAIDGTRCF